ncbi:MAG: bifunctional riboflavin kinase/FAD synthetase [Anaerolineaceae bacterium]
MPSSLSDFSLQLSWVTIGSFDGVHLGHQALVRRLAQGARMDQSEAVVITFDPHPAVFFKRVPPSNLLTSPEEREELLCSLGIDRVITLQFDAALANLTAREFMLELKQHLGIVHLLTGVDFALGKDRMGDLTTLARLGSEFGFGVETIPPTRFGDQVVSSSQIRQFLQSEQLDKANAWLGRPYRLTGSVVHGEARGTRLGFPTANMEIPSERLIPSDGVYVTRATVNGVKYDAVTNIGTNPTFANTLTAPRVEPHFLDVREDFYDQKMDLDFLQFLRPEIKFADVQSLIDQINLDIQKAREVLAHGA